MDLDTCGGGISIQRLMGNHVQVSGEDTATGAAAAGSVRIGAVYADSLVLKSGAHAQLACSISPSTASPSNAAFLTATPPT